MSDVNEIISKLNEEQIKPVLDTEGAVLVIAGAGSGKTRVLTSRIAYLVMEKHVSPHRILAITFTNKAAAEMKERLSVMIGDVSDMWVLTIHSMCVRILRRDADKIGFDKNFTIYDDGDKDKVLKRVLEKLGLDADKYLKISKNYISAAKNDCLSPAEFKQVYADLRTVDEIARIYEAYDNALAHSNAFDFDDLLCKTYELFCKCPEVADYYAERFLYLHIDEFQDTNKVQFAIAQRLSLKNGNIFVVGDDDQSIYGWRGAKIENILSFDDIYRGAKVYKLQRNYRSTKKILDLANKIIVGNKTRREKQLWTENSDGAPVEVYVGNDENDEATYAAMQIKNIVNRDDCDYKDFAVLMRVNAISRAYEQEFTKYGIPYRVYGGFRFFERKEIKDLLSYLKIISNTNDDEAFLRAVAFPKRGIGEKTLSELREYATSEGLSLYDAIDYLGGTTIGSAAKTKLTNFKGLLSEFKQVSSSEKVDDLMSYILKNTSFCEQFAEKTEENEARLYNISELLNTAEQFVKENPSLGLGDYLNSVTLSTDTDNINESNAVTIATIHAVKGLEYKAVFIAGLDEKIMPISRAVDNDDELEEERRLMYVAITRARERLFLTRACSRYMYGQREYMMQSRFLNDASVALGRVQPRRQNSEPLKRYEHLSDYGGNDLGFSGGAGGYSSNYAKTFLNSSAPKEQKKSVSGEYKCGTKVKHVKFGDGVVVNVKGEGDNLIVNVAFNNVGIKALSVKYAPMEIING